MVPDYMAEMAEGTVIMAIQDPVLMDGFNVI
jgi:hypothetical protein